MSKESYELLLPRVKIIPEKDIKKPLIAIDQFCMEATHVYNLTKADKEMFCAFNFAWELVEILPKAIGGLRYAESRCVIVCECKEEKRRWDEAFERAKFIRELLISRYKLAFRHTPMLLEKMSEILNGTAYSDFFQDLADLSLLGKTNAELLNAIKFDFAVLDEAESAPRILTELYARDLRTTTHKLCVSSYQSIIDFRLSNPL